MTPVDKDKRHGWKSGVGCLIRQTLKEDRRTYRPKHYEYSNKDEDNTSITLNDKNHAHIIINLHLARFSHQCWLVDFHRNLSDSKFPEISRTLLSTLTDLSNAVVWMVSTSLEGLDSSSKFQVFLSLFKSLLGPFQVCQLQLVSPSPSCCVPFLFFFFFFFFLLLLLLLLLLDKNCYWNHKIAKESDFGKK